MITNHLTPIHWQNQNVITTELLARSYATEEANIRKNHQRNSERFIDGTHFYKLEGEALRVFKAESHKETNCHSVKIANNVNSIILWTEKGAARHAKILETDEAWDAFEKLEEAYFHPERRMQSMAAQIDQRRLQQQYDLLKRFTLRNNKIWRKIVRYYNMGLNNYEIAKLLSIGESTVRAYITQMQACGILPKAASLDLLEGV